MMIVDDCNNYLDNDEDSDDVKDEDNGGDNLDENHLLQHWH